MASNKTIFIAIILVLLATNYYLYEKLSLAKEEAAAVKQAEGANIERSVGQTKIISFGKTFLEKVLGTNNEIDLEDRLKLENEVLELSDEEILMQWNKFTASKTEAEAQEEVVNLLSLILNKI